MYDENGNEIIVRSYHKDKKETDALALMQTRSGITNNRFKQKQVTKRGVIGPYFLF